MRFAFTSWTESLGSLEQEYRIHYLPADATQMSIAITVWQIPNILFAYADFQLFNNTPLYWYLAANRMALLAFSGYAIHALREASTPEIFDRILLRWFIVVITLVLYINAAWAPVVPANIAISVLILLSTYLVIPSKMMLRFIPAFYLTFGNILVSLRFGPPVDSQSTYLILVALLMANLLGIIFSGKLYAYRRMVFLALSKEAKIKDELNHLASTDELTGVFNRRKLMELAQQEFDLFKRCGKPLAVLMIDLDYFKILNDQHGHQAGDKILTRFTAFVAQNIRQTDIWGRLGGEEFVLILSGTDREQAEIISERFRYDTSQLITRVGGDLLNFTVSIGVTTASDKDKTFTDVLTRSDTALYRAKNNGRNRIEVA
jgi:diguanylate cyclase (GGDEF)-like protein